MMTAGTYLVFNCYEVVKQQWYETIAFKIFIFIVMIAIAVVFPPAAPGLLGMNATVGAAIGFTGLMAAIAGAIANALVTMILMQVISLASVEILGPKIGVIVATIASVVTMTVGTSLSNGASMAQVWGNMMSASNLIQLTSAVGNGVAGYMQASTAEWMGKTQELMAEYAAKAKEYEELFLREFGNGNFAFDPSLLTDQVLGELPESFLTRTLLTGSDIAELSTDMLSNFADYSLRLDTMGS